jgi:hypothetical protein
VEGLSLVSHHANQSINEAITVHLTSNNKSGKHAMCKIVDHSLDDPNTD